LCKSEIFKKIFILDNISGLPCELTKTVKYFSYWESSNKEEYTETNNWFFAQYSKEIIKLLFLIKPPAMPERLEKAVVI
jgi:hypothetical protein